MPSTTNTTGLSLLRALPVISTTASITWALGELVFLSSFFHPTVRPPHGRNPFSETRLSGNTGNTQPKDHATACADAVRRVLPPFFNVYFHRGVWVVLAFNTLSWSTLAWNLYRGNLSPDARKWYRYGLAAVLGHLAFIPCVAGSVSSLCEWKEDPEEIAKDVEGPVDVLKEWLGVHVWRMICADVPALVCCLLGFLA